MIQRHLYKRLTHKYVDSCRHLDSHEFVATIKLTPPRQLEEGNGFDDLGTYVQFARVPASADRQEVARAAADTLSNWGCSHEYDCCGCTLGSARSTLRGRTLIVHTSVGRNY